MMQWLKNTTWKQEYIQSSICLCKLHKYSNEKIGGNNEILPIKGLNYYFIISGFLNKLEFLSKNIGVSIPQLISRELFHSYRILSQYLIIFYQIILLAFVLIFTILILYLKDFKFVNMDNFPLGYTNI